MTARRLWSPRHRQPVGIPSDLPSAGRTPRPDLADVFDHDPRRNLGQPAVSREIPALPDGVLISTMTWLGAPRWWAENIRHHPQLRFAAVAVWCLVQDAREGKSVINARTGETVKARELVDAMREEYQQARWNELVDDVPEHTLPLGT